MSLKVTAPMITARTENDRIVYLYFGDIVPNGLSKESLDHLKALGFVKDDEAPGITILEQPVMEDVPEPVVGGDVVKPAGNAGIEEWHAYALAQGATADDLEGLSRNEVRDLYK